MSRLAFVDIETTGTSHRQGKIIEIGIVLTRNLEIIDQFSSLIDPDMYISPAITDFTGITQFDLEKAPTFRGVHEKILSLLTGTIFVAHNVAFDYGFIRSEFTSLNIPFHAKKLCTVKLARALLPHLRSHNLDTLIDHFNLPVIHRHRALSDALSTYHLVKFLSRHSNQAIFTQLGWP